MLPVLVVYIIFQRQVQSGLTAGAASSPTTGTLHPLPRSPRNAVGGWAMQNARPCWWRWMPGRAGRWCCCDPLADERHARAGPAEPVADLAAAVAAREAADRPRWVWAGHRRPSTRRCCAPGSGSTAATTWS